jgi:hypothetical protein
MVGVYLTGWSLRARTAVPGGAGKTRFRSRRLNSGKIVEN